MVLFSAHTGLVEAVLLDNGYLTDVRTALAGAIAAKYLARGEVEAVGVLGTGSQARFQVEALKLVREFSRVLVWGRVSSKAEACAKDISASLGVEVVTCAHPEDVVTHSMIVVTATPATAPLIESRWLHPGLHITAMGADAEHKNEFDPDIIKACDTYVCDTRAQSVLLGELHHAIEKGVVPPDVEVTELGQLIIGEREGRRDRGEVTVCDLTGMGAQDTAIARLAFQKAIAASAGTKFES
jgi:ornithine cyclodeaminase/alanine dehydrogenase-like protein (mu-crystallin family)